MGNSLKCCECDKAPPKFYEMRLQQQQAEAQKKPALSALPDLRETELKEETAEHRATLKLTIMSTADSALVSELEITPEGLRHSLRGPPDGKVYFGCKKRASALQDGEKGEILNDFLLPIDDKSLRSQHRGRHFVVSYDARLNSFLIKDLGVGFGVFVRLEFPIQIQENHLLSIGESFCIFSLSGTSSNSVLQVKVFTNSTTGSSL